MILKVHGPINSNFLFQSFHRLDVRNNFIYCSFLYLTYHHGYDDPGILLSRPILFFFLFLPVIQTKHFLAVKLFTMGYEKKIWTFGGGGVRATQV